MPFTGDKGGFPLSSFLDKAASRITSDRPDVVGNDAKADAVQAKFLESMLQDEADRFSSKSHPELVRVI